MTKKMNLNMKSMMMNN